MKVMAARLQAAFVLAAMMMMMMMTGGGTADAQPVPQPFPRPEPSPPPTGGATPEPPPPSTDPGEPPATPDPAPSDAVETPAEAPPDMPALGVIREEAPSDETLGLPVYPTATFLASYDAGFGQRYYLFGTLDSYDQIVAYYRIVLREGGTEVFEEPPTYMFEIGRFREATMAFPPGVTVKDYAWGELGGYLNPDPHGEPERFPTVIQIVPPVVEPD